MAPVIREHYPEPVATVAVVAGLVLLGWILTRAILASARHRPSAMVAVSLSVLTLVALGGFILTGLEVLATLAATGFGAITGAMTALFYGRHPDDSDDERVP